MIDFIEHEDILINIYKDIHKIVKDYEDIGNLMLYYFDKIIKITMYNDRSNILKVSEILDKLSKELLDIYYKEYIYEKYIIKKIYIRLNNIKNDDTIIEKHVNTLKILIHNKLYNYIHVINNINIDLYYNLFL